MICRDQPRERFVHLPTPLEPAPRLSEALGIDLLIKREDLAGLCVGGNKARLLEFAIGSLRDNGVDTLVAYASDQSNKLRDIAAVAARCGMRAVLLVPGDGRRRGAAGQPPALRYPWCRCARDGARPRSRGRHGGPGGGARRMSPAPDGRAAILDRHLDYGIDATIGLVDAAEELHGQLPPCRVRPVGVHRGRRGHDRRRPGARAEAPRLAGAGHRGLHCQPRRGGSRRRSSVMPPAPPRRLGIATRLAAADLTLIDDQPAIRLRHGDAAAVEVIRRFARLHGLVLDPVYNAKVARGAGRPRRGRPDPERRDASSSSTPAAARRSTPTRRRWPAAWPPGGRPARPWRAG